jgi:hypothetical protein
MSSATAVEQPSALEIANAQKVLGYLSDMDDVSYKTVREDIFAVSNHEAGVECVVDVEESIVCIFVEVCDVPESGDERNKLNELLMGLNNKAVHGKFATNNGKVFFRDNLEFENLDKNELEASLTWVFGMVGGNIEEISGIIEQDTVKLP